MFETLFGSELPLPVRFFLAFLVVLGLIGATAWAVRRFGTGRLGGASARGRQPRLGVIDYASVDARRRLILVRRDNVEHLLMIGGPTDVVVEANIIRAVAATSRDVPLARPPAVEPLPRAMPLPENGNGSSWPLQPEPAMPPAPRATPKFEPPAEEPAGIPLQPAAETPAKPQRDTLAALADELSARPTPPPRNRSPLPTRTSQAEPRSEPRPEPRVPASQPAPVPVSAETAAADQSLAEMAHRLEAALRKPGAPAPAAASSRPTPPAEPNATPEMFPPGPPPRVARPIEPKAPRSEAKPNNPTTLHDNIEPKVPRSEAKPNNPTTLYDNLEQEMASLLGRPTNKN
jgi:flagellar protein FliO/FliZ